MSHPEVPLSDNGAVTEKVKVTPSNTGPASVTQTVVEAQQVEGAAAPTLKLRLVKKDQVSLERDHNLYSSNPIEFPL